MHRDLFGEGAGEHIVVVIVVVVVVVIMIIVVVVVIEGWPLSVSFCDDKTDKTDMSCRTC